MRPAIRARVVVAAIVVALSAASCTGDDSPSAEQPELTGNLADALDSLPAGTELVRFVDRDLATQRLGVDGVDSLADDAAVAAYEEKVRSAEWATTELGSWVVAMSRAGGFSDLDVRWAARGGVGEPGRLDGWSLFAMDKELDLDTVAEALLTAGYTESAVDGHRQLTAPTPTDSALVDGVYPYYVLQQVTLVPERHLLVTGKAASVLDVVAGDEPSLLDASTFTPLVEDVPPVEYAELRSRSVTDCAAPIRGTGTMTPDALAAIRQTLGMEGLGTPESTAVLVAAPDGEPRAVTLLRFADEAAAAADAKARATYLSVGLDMVTRERNAELYDVTSLLAEGDIVTAEWAYTGGIGPGVRASQAGAGTVACVS